MTEPYTVLRLQGGKKSEYMYVTENTILDLNALVRKGHTHVVMVPESVPSATCPDCGAAQIEIDETNAGFYRSDDEPHTVGYLCDRLVLKDYGTAEFRKCENKKVACTEAEAEAPDYEREYFLKRIAAGMRIMNRLAGYLPVSCDLLDFSLRNTHSDRFAVRCKVRTQTWLPRVCCDQTHVYATNQNGSEFVAHALLDLNIKELAELSTAVSTLVQERVGPYLRSQYEVEQNTRLESALVTRLFAEEE